MPEFVDSTVKEIDNRLRSLKEEVSKLESLKEEVSKLEAARAALIGGRRRPGRPPGSGSRSTRRRSTRRPGRPRGSRNGGTRSDQALKLVQSQPGITIPQIAENLKIEPNYLYRVMPKLASDGQVRREGQGWFPAEAS